MTVLYCTDTLNTLMRYICVFSKPQSVGYSDRMRWDNLLLISDAWRVLRFQCDLCCVPYCTSMLIETAILVLSTDLKKKKKMKHICLLINE